MRLLTRGLAIFSQIFIADDLGTLASNEEAFPGVRLGLLKLQELGKRVVVVSSSCETRAKACRRLSRLAVSGCITELDSALLKPGMPMVSEHARVDFCCLAGWRMSATLAPITKIAVLALLTGECRDFGRDPSCQRRRGPRPCLQAQSTGPRQFRSEGGFVRVTQRPLIAAIGRSNADRGCNLHHCPEWLCD